MENLLKKMEENRLNKTFANGLSGYTQANCQVTLTDNGLRIYRPANCSTAASGGANNMWGGMKLQPYAIANKDVLIKGHTYIIKFHIKGKSSNANATGDLSCCFWSNNMGWTTATSGLKPTPSNVSYKCIPANFDGEMDCFYKWTINDDVWKTCTTAYSSFKAGTKYLSYRDFGFGWNYINTGSLGTNIYVTNIRMYDLTNGNQNISLIQNGVLQCSPQEQNSLTSFSKDGEILSHKFYEI